MAPIPKITNGLARNALQFSKDVTVYTNFSESVTTSMTPLLSTTNTSIKLDPRPIVRLIKEKTAAEVTIELSDGEKVIDKWLLCSRSEK